MFFHSENPFQFNGKQPNKFLKTPMDGFNTQDTVGVTRYMKEELMLLSLSVLLNIRIVVEKRQKK